MRLDLELQRAVSDSGIPPVTDFERWARAALEGRREVAELVVRIVDEAESAQLNERFRGKAGPTNVLSFPFRAPPPVRTDLLGDLVICASVVRREATEQGKEGSAHWAHMVVHGVLHLLGYDHLQEEEAQQMEALERRVLAGLGFPDPYADEGSPGG
jgi:probable rRNA maturation factor